MKTVWKLMLVNVPGIVSHTIVITELSDTCSPKTKKEGGLKKNKTKEVSKCMGSKHANSNRLSQIQTHNTKVNLSLYITFVIRCTAFNKE